MITPREKDLSPRFGNAGRDHRDHLAQSIKASYRHHLFRNLGWAGEESWVGFISSHLWKKQMLQANANANITAQGGEGGGCEFPEQTAPSQTSGWSSSTETIWKSKWSTDHPDHTPLEISNLFLLESEHSSRNKVGSSLWLFIPNIKTSDKILKYKIQNKQTKAVWLFGRPYQRPRPGPPQNPHAQPLCLSWGSSGGYLAEVHLTRSAAGLPVLQLQ